MEAGGKMVLVKLGIRPMTDKRKAVRRHLDRQRTEQCTCGTKNDSCNDLRDDPGLPDFAERVSEELCHTNYYH